MIVTLPRWSEEEEERLGVLYPGATEWSSLLSRFPERTARALQGKARALGLMKVRLPKSLKAHDPGVFSRGDEAAAYLLGFIEADGYVTYSRTGVARVHLNLCIEDESHLDTIRRCLGVTSPILYALNSWHGKRVARITGASRAWADFLRDNYRIGRVPEGMRGSLLPHYVRGYFDGDGSAYRQKGRIMANMVFASETLANDMLSLVAQPCGLTAGLRVYRKTSSEHCWYFRMAASSVVSRFADWIYEDATIYLPRKRDVLKGAQ